MKIRDIVEKLIDNGFIKVKTNHFGRDVTIEFKVRDNGIAVHVVGESHKDDTSEIIAKIQKIHYKVVELYSESNQIIEELT